MPLHNTHDNERFEALLRDFGRIIKSYCIRRSSSAAEAADLVQEVAMKLWNSIGDLNEDSAPRQVNRWIHKIMRSTVTDHFRRKRVKVVPLSEADGIAVIPEVDNSLIDDLLQR